MLSPIEHWRGWRFTNPSLEELGLQLASLDQPLPELRDQAEVLVSMADETVALMHRLESMKNVQPHLDACHPVLRIGVEARALFSRT